MRFFTKDEVINIVKEAWFLTNPGILNKDIPDFKLKDFEVLEAELKSFFNENPNFNIDLVSAGALMNLVKFGENKRTKAMAEVGLFILLKKDLLTKEEKERFNVKILGKNLLSNYPKRVEVLTLLKERFINEKEGREDKTKGTHNNLLMIFILFLITGLTLLGAYSLRKDLTNIQTIEPFWNVETCESYPYEPCLVRLTYDFSNLKYKKAYFDFEKYGQVDVTDKKGEFNRVLNIDSIKFIHLTIDKNSYKKDLVPVPTLWRGKANDVFIPNSTFQNSGYLHVSDSTLNKLFNKNEAYYITYSKGRAFNYDLNNVSFEVRVKNDVKGGGISCFDVSLDLYAQQNNEGKQMGFNLLAPGCTDWAKITIGDTTYNNQNFDVSPSGIDMNDWKVVKWNFQNRSLTIWVDNLQLYDIPFKEDLGLLKYVQVLFKGNGYLDYYKIISNNGELLMDDQFNEH